MSDPSSSHAPALWRFIQRAAIAIGVLLVLYTAIGFLALPYLIGSRAKRLATEKLHRQLSIGKIRVNPFALTLNMQDVKLTERDSTAVFAAFDLLAVDLSAQSIRKLAPVVQSVQLMQPVVHLIHVDQRRTNIDDIIELVASQPASEKQAQFSVNNVQVDGGQVTFEDRPAKTTHTVAAIKLGIPFISSLPTDVEIFVEPLLSAKVNGTPLLVKGKARPFAEPKEAFVDLNLDDLDLTHFLAYLPLQPGFKIPTAHLSTKLTASFQQPKNKAPALVMNGSVTLRAVRIDEPNGKAMLKLPELVMTLRDARPFGSRIDVAKVKLSGLEADIVQARDGQFNVSRMLISPKPEAASPQIKPAAAATKLAINDVEIDNAALRFTGEQASSPMQANVEKLHLGLHRIALDTTAMTVAIDEVVSNSASLFLRQNKAGNAATKAPGDAGAGKSGAVPPQAKPGYAVQVKRLALQQWNARLEDGTQAKPVAATIGPLDLVAQDLSSAPGATTKINLKTGVDKTGQIAMNGTATLAPLRLNLAIDIKALDLLPAQPYFSEQVNLRFTHANLSAKGQLNIEQAPGGKTSGGFIGGLSLDNVVGVDQTSDNDFIRWQSLALNGVDARLEPLALTVNDIALKDFFARIIIDPSGRINVQNITRAHAGDKKSLTTVAEGDPLAAAATSTPAAPPAAAATTAPAASASASASRKLPPIVVKKLVLSGGRVRFTDNFIKPNYTANLMNFGGTVSGLSSDPASTASVDLHGEVNRAPLSVVGRVNPLREDVLLDVKATVRGMELAALSPYSGRYLGYGIEKGKLSFEVAYVINNRRLTAQNRLTLEQLTLGDKIESPTATKLPLQFALALLRDRNGVIDVNVPIGGSLDDPQFSVGGIILKVIGNVILKAVTQPFALIGSLFGGGGQELSWMGFDPGRAAVTANAEDKLKSIAKALNDRPALKLEITGRADAATDSEALKRVSMERKVRAQKRKNLEARGQTMAPGTVTIAPDEYPALLKQVYKEEKFDKPRNAIGLQKDLPVEEMEKLMIANATVGDEDIAALANQRAQAAKDWLLKSGKVPGERIYLIGARSGAPDGGESKEKAPPSRVDFSLR